MLRLLPLMLIAAMGAATLAGCEEEKKEVVEGHLNPEVDPTMLTRDVETLISDSGIMRYRIKAPLWLVFDNANEPRWTFPQGVNLEKFDDFFHRQATVECDSATYFTTSKIWRLDGHVYIENMAGEKFATNQLYWDQRYRKVYSDSFIHIEQPERTLEGYGFESNERFTTYAVRRVSGMFPVESLKAAATDVDSAGHPVGTVGAPPVQSPAQYHGTVTSPPTTQHQ